MCSRLSHKHSHRPKFHLARLDTTRHVRVYWAVLFQHGGRRRNSSAWTACVYKFSVLCSCALSVHVNKTEKKTTRCVGERIGLSKKIETFGCYNSLLMSDLMNHNVIWSNYSRIDIELFEELFNHARYHILLFII